MTQKMRLVLSMMDAIVVCDMHGISYESVENGFLENGDSRIGTVLQI